MWEVYGAFLLSFRFYFYLPKKNIMNVIQSYMVCNGTNALGCAYSKQSKTEKPACFFWRIHHIAALYFVLLFIICDASIPTACQ